MSKKRSPGASPRAGQQDNTRSYTLPNGVPIEVRNLPGKDKKAISKRVAAIGKVLYHDITEQRLRSVTVVTILTGGLVFTADLLRALHDGRDGRETFTVRLEVIKASKYQGRNAGPCRPQFDLLDTEAVKGQHVILVDDVVDSGETLRTAHDHLIALGAETVTPVVLLVKQGAQDATHRIHLGPTGERILLDHDTLPEDRRRQGHVGFVVDPVFVVGYGLDYDGVFRDLSFLGQIE